MSLSIDTTSYPSPNFSDRDGATIDMLILHTGEGSKQSDLARLRNDQVILKNRVSSHYYVDRQGRVYQLVDPMYAAWHAGVSSWNGRAGPSIMAHSIGIESEHKAGQDWPAVQRTAYADLCRFLIARHPITQRNVAAHRWIAPGRKFDPTDWPDEQLRPWITALFSAPATPYRVKAPMWISETPTPRGPIALGGQALVWTDDIVLIDEVKNDMAHTANGVGFLPIGGLEKV